MPFALLPAALPLLATGLGALGLIGWRRKRRENASGMCRRWRARPVIEISEADWRILDKFIAMAPIGDRLLAVG